MTLSAGIICCVLRERERANTRLKRAEPESDCGGVFERRRLRLTRDRAAFWFAPGVQSDRRAQELVGKSVRLPGNQGRDCLSNPALHTSPCSMHEMSSRLTAGRLKKLRQQSASSESVLPLLMASARARKIGFGVGMKCCGGGDGEREHKIPLCHLALAESFSASFLD